MKHININIIMAVVVAWATYFITYRIFGWVGVAIQAAIWSAINVIWARRKIRDLQMAGARKLIWDNMDNEFIRKAWRIARSRAK